MKNKWWIWVLLVALALLIIGIMVYYEYDKITGRNVPSSMKCKQWEHKWVECIAAGCSWSQNSAGVYGCGY